MQRVLHIVRIIRDDDELIVGIVLAQPFDGLQDIARRLDHVGIAVLIDQHIDGVLAVQPAIARAACILLAHRRHGRQRYHPAIGILHLHLLNVLSRLILCHHTDIGLRRLRIDRAGGQQLVLILDSRRDLRQRQLIGRHLIAVDLDGYLLVAPAVQLDFRYAAGLLQGLLEDVVRHRIGVGQAMLADDRQFDDWLGIDITLDDHRRVRFIGQPVLDRLDLLGRIDGRRIGIRPKIELQHDACALIAGRRSDFLDIGNRGQGILDGFDDFLLHGVRARPRIFDRDRDKGRIECWQQLHANAVVAVHAEHHKEQDNHRDAHRTIDGKTRQIHCHPSTLSSTSTLVPVCNLS